MRQSFFCLILVAVLVWPAMAQWPELATDIIDTVEERKAELFRYRQMRLAETLQTASQLQYDVLSYDIDITLDPEHSTLSGMVVMTARALNNFMNGVDLDLADHMTVNHVTVYGDSVSFSHQNGLVSVQFNSTVSSGQSIEVKIDYSGRPMEGGADYFRFTNHDGKPVIWSLSEPFGARNWWPCKDQPSDKADSVDIRVTIPKGLIVASNGTLRSVTGNGETDTYWWHEGYPIATYLVSVAIHEYATYSDYYKYSPTDSMEIQFYVFPDHLNSVKPNFAKTKNMIAIYSDLFGQYPFIEEKYGHAEFTWGGGMEHQTCTSLGAWSESLIAHELAHMWWGDMVTCRDFHHIWLNEGFATYAEALYWEQVRGSSGYFNDMNATKYFGPGTIYVPSETDESRIFDSNLSYNKGSWVLHMLRHVVGDETFFDILHAYYDSQYQYGTATTEDFRSVCEAVSGKELDWYFEEWIYGQYYPAYIYSWTLTPEGETHTVTVIIEQVQTNTGVFTMPVDVTFSASGREETRVVFNDQQTQSFEFDLDFAPTSVSLDKKGWILKSVGERDLQVTSPNGGELWGMGSTQTIRWSSKNTGSTVTIDYSTDGGSTWQPVISGTPNDGSHPWTVPYTPSANCLVRIADPSHILCTDQSNQAFTLCEALHADFTADKTALEGQPCLVQFFDHSSGPVTGWSWNFGDGGTSTERDPSHSFVCGYSYTVSLTATGACASSVMKKDACITCTCPCRMDVISPIGGELVCSGDSLDIRWTSGATTGEISIQYSLDNGLSWAVALDGTADDGMETWVVPEVSATTCLVRIHDAANPGCSTTSPSPFQICRCGAISIVSDILPSGSVGCGFGESVETWGGCAPYDWSVVSGQLPGGLDLDAANGILLGTPTEAGTFDFTLQVRDVQGNEDRKDLFLQIDEYVSAKGDVNTDCMVNILDVLAVVNSILELNHLDADKFWRADCNSPAGACDGDGVVNILDALKMISIILGADTCP